MLVHLEVQDEIVMNREEADLHWELIFKKCISIQTSYRGDRRDTTKCYMGNTAPTASVPSSNGSVPTTKWPRPDSTDHCTITKRCYYTGSDSHSTGSSRSRPTTGMSTNNGTANVERSIPSFFSGIGQIRELIL